MIHSLHFSFPSHLLLISIHFTSHKLCRCKQRSVADECLGERSRESSIEPTPAIQRVDAATGLKPTRLHLEVVGGCLDAGLDAVEGDDEGPLHHADEAAKEDTVAGLDLSVLILGEQRAENAIKTEDDDLGGDVADESGAVSEVELLDAAALPQLVGAVDGAGVDAVGVLGLCGHADADEVEGGVDCGVRGSADGSTKGVLPGFELHVVLHTTTEGIMWWLLLLCLLLVIVLI